MIKRFLPEDDEQFSKCIGFYQFLMEQSQNCDEQQQFRKVLREQQRNKSTAKQAKVSDVSLSKCASILFVQPEKFINPYNVFLLGGDVLLVEDLLDAKNCSDYQFLSSWNQFKYIDSAVKSKNGNLHIFLQNRIAQQPPAEYIVKRFRSKGLQRYAQFADLIERVYQKLSENSSESNLLLLAKNSSLQEEFKTHMIHHEASFVNNLMNYLDKHFDQNEKMYMCYAGKTTKNRFEIHSIHYSFKLLDSLNYTPDEFLNLMSKHGILNLFTNEGLDQVYLKNIVDIANAYHVEQQYYDGLLPHSSVVKKVYGMSKLGERYEFFNSGIEILTMENNNQVYIQQYDIPQHYKSKMMKKQQQQGFDSLSTKSQNYCSMQSQDMTKFE